MLLLCCLILVGKKNNEFEFISVITNLTYKIDVTIFHGTEVIEI